MSKKSSLIYIFIIIIQVTFICSEGEFQMIKIKDVTYSYNGTPVITELSFSFLSSNIYTIIGENGSGKTTLLRLILGLLKPESGSIQFEEKAIISYLPDHNGLYEDLSITDNIRFRLALYKQSFSTIQNEYYSLLNKYHLYDKRDEPISSLSLGMKKKAAIIATTLVHANVYIFDEPTGGIDHDAKIEIISLFKEIDLKQKCILIVTHDEELLSEVPSVLLKMQGGRLME